MSEESVNIYVHLPINNGLAEDMTLVLLAANGVTPTRSVEGCCDFFGAMIERTYT